VNVKVAEVDTGEIIMQFRDFIVVTRSDVNLWRFEIFWHDN